MPTIKNIFKASIFILLVTFLPLYGNDQQISGCECYQNYSSYVPETYVPSEQAATAAITPAQEIVVRAAIDIGSGATKLRVAEVNLKTHKIEKILVNESFPVQYQEHLSKSQDNAFDEQVMQTGMDAIKKSAQIAQQYQAQKVIAVATASFRKAANSEAFSDRILKETGVRVYVIDQDLEGKLAFNAVLSQGNYDPKNLIVWDIGGGSLQMTSQDDPNDGYQIFRGEVASIHFKNMMIQDIQHKDIQKVTTPNPMSASEIQQGEVKARELAQKVSGVFKERISQPNAQVVGVGNIFAYGIYPLVGKKSPFTQQELEQAALTLANKDDQQVGGGDYANVQVSNTILVLGYMQALHINQMYVVDVNNADGAMLYPDFW